MVKTRARQTLMWEAWLKHVHGARRQFRCTFDHEVPPGRSAVIEIEMNHTRDWFRKVYKKYNLALGNGKER